jgi:hypothetical protein
MNNYDHQIVSNVREHLTDDLRSAKFRGHECKTAGHCYVASEAVYHALGGKAAGYTPMQIKHEGTSHWFLKHSSGKILDATSDQFATAVPYEKAKGRGFLTKEPSRRAKTLMSRLESNL